MDELMNKWWDYSFLLEAMEKWLRLHSEKVLSEGTHLYGHKYAKRALVMAELLKRIQEDDYIDMAKKVYGVSVVFDFEPLPTGGCRLLSEISDEKAYKRALHHADLLKRQDLELFGKYFAKYITSLWD